MGVQAEEGRSKDQAVTGPRSDEESREVSRERETAEGEGSPSFLQAPVRPGPPGSELEEPGEDTGPWGRCRVQHRTGHRLGAGWLPAPPTVPREPHPSPTVLPGTRAPPEVCSLTPLLPALTHSLDACSEVSGDCRPGGTVTPSAHSHTHHSGDPSSVSNSSAGVNYVPLLASSWGHGGHSPT